MKKKFSIQKGFTLLELLISTAIFTILAAVIVTVLFTSLRASKKSDVISLLNRSGNNALSQMVRTIRYAKSLDDPVSCVPSITQSSITISGFDDAPTVLSCPAGASTAITSNSASLTDSTAISVSACSFTCTQPTTSDPPTIMLQFTLSPKNQNSLVETTGTLPFQTSVTMRNFGQ